VTNDPPIQDSGSACINFDYAGGGQRVQTRDHEIRLIQ